MSPYKDAKIEAAFLKMGIYGGNGSGKTFTASLIAIGLHKFIESKKPIYFTDSETGSDYVIPLFNKAKINLKVSKTRAFTDLLLDISNAEEGSIVIIDSVTHFWDDLIESYKKKKNLKRISHPSHWMEIKPIWRDFTKEFVVSKLHIIVCGRAGDVWEDVEDSEGVKELKRTGSRMRVEKELGYEPSLLVEMEKARLSSKAGAGWSHRAWVVKDRFDIIDSQHFDNPTFESFLSHIELLNLGGEHKALEADRDSQELFDNSNNGYERQRQRVILLEKIKEELYIPYPGQGTDDKRGRSDLMNEIFKTRSWTEVEGKYPNDLQVGLTSLEEENQKKELEEKPQAEKKEKKK